MQNTFAPHSEVEIRRGNSDTVFEALVQEKRRGTFDLVYVDANHQYEWVLRDLILYEQLVGPDGFIMVNDCCHSTQGVAQNLGVLEAVTSFLKRRSFVPLALTNRSGPRRATRRPSRRARVA